MCVCVCLPAGRPLSSLYIHSIPASLHPKPRQLRTPRSLLLSFHVSCTPLLGFAAAQPVNGGTGPLVSPRVRFNQQVAAQKYGGHGPGPGSKRPTSAGPGAARGAGSADLELRSVYQDIIGNNKKVRAVKGGEGGLRATG